MKTKQRKLKRINSMKAQLSLNPLFRPKKYFLSNPSAERIEPCDRRAKHRARIDVDGPQFSQILSTERIYIVDFFLPSVCVVCIIFLYCNRKTMQQRTVMLDKVSDYCRTDIHDLSEIDSIYKVFDHVSYERHLWYLLTHRNPSRLYNAYFSKNYFYLTV